MLAESIFRNCRLGSTSKMGLSTYSSAADAGILCVILANTAISISIMKEIFRSVLLVIGIRISSLEEFTMEQLDSVQCHKSPSESYMEEFRSRTPSVRYDSMFACDCPKQECSVCLAEFEPNAEVNQLSCGHVFHSCCLEKWLNYWNITCPLCRSNMVPQEEAEEDACPM